MADAPFARPHGIPDGYIGAVRYAAILLLLFVPPGQRWAWPTVAILGLLAVMANVKGVDDMSQLGAFCAYCLLTTAASPVRLWIIWRLR